MIPFISQMAREAGHICLEERARLTLADLSFKSAKDLVTVADRRVEMFLVSTIKKNYPDHCILGEETGETTGTAPIRWIIDPIDGTTSFVHHQPFYSVSIALEKNGCVIASGVYAPVLDELFVAEKGKGASLNGTPIRVSDTFKMEHAVMATGFACLRAGWADNNLRYLNRIAPGLRDVRRYGSAALDLCYTACGRLDGYWEMNLNLYDIAAGALILSEAGGRVSDFNGTDRFPENGTAAANPHLHPKLLDHLKN
ncbi:MAG TPA: inositol monophosphatase [Desulfobacteraceae bacterium]|nr:inositol monophosphatase [Desulfobacteraceae bacterium]